ncbi:MAG: hypothetical protein ACYDH5_18475 [Acidimicrobiales bacterium]
MLARCGTWWGGFAGEEDHGARGLAGSLLAGGGSRASQHSASMDDALLADARAEAEAEGLTLSSWLAGAAAADRLRLKGLGHLVEEWEAEHGAISVAELDALEDKVVEARRSAKDRRRRPGTEAGRAVAS